MAAALGAESKSAFLFLITADTEGAKKKKEKKMLLMLLWIQLTFVVALSLTWHHYQTQCVSTLNYQAENGSSVCLAALINSLH